MLSVALLCSVLAFAGALRNRLLTVPDLDPDLVVYRDMGVLASGCIKRCDVTEFMQKYALKMLATLVDCGSEQYMTKYNGTEDFIDQYKETYNFFVEGLKSLDFPVFVTNQDKIEPYIATFLVQSIDFVCYGGYFENFVDRCGEAYTLQNVTATVGDVRTAICEEGMVNKESFLKLLQFQLENRNW